MGIAVFPAPSSGISVADGTSAGWSSGEPSWELITSSTSTGATVTFSSISGYRYLRLLVREYQGGSNIKVTFNSSNSGYTHMQKGILSGGSSFAITSYTNSDAFYLSYYSPTNGYTHPGGWVDIFDVNTSLPYKSIASHGSYINSSQGEHQTENWGTWKNTSEITSLTLTLNSTGYGGTAGGLALYGAN
jgi:hypothetical protein